MCAPWSSCIIATLAIGLLVGCGGSSKAPKDPSAPSPTTIHQATAIATSELSAVHALMPTVLVPPGLRARAEGEEAAADHLLPNPPSQADLLNVAARLIQRQAKVPPPPLAPCSPIYTSATNAEGVTTESWDYSVCTNGFSGKLILTYHYTATTWRYDVTFEHFYQSYTLGEDTFRYAIHGTWSFMGALDASGHSYTFSYKTGPGGVTLTTTKNGSSQMSVVLTDDTTCQWKVTHAKPLKATFTLYGFFGETGSFVAEDGVLVNGNYEFRIPQGTPLIWEYEAASSANCRWPTSGVIRITNGPETLNFTFTAVCGQAIMNPGNKVVDF